MTEVKIPTHPEIHSYAWTKLELAAIKQYGDDRARAAYETLAVEFEDEFTQDGSGISRLIRLLAKEIK